MNSSFKLTAPAPYGINSFSTTRKPYLLFSFLLLGLPSFLLAQQRKTPLMGWASWNNFSVNISESIIKSQADAMVSSGLADAGYRYINIDDGYFKGRYTDGTFRSDSIKFPHGMKAVADYIHTKGLKAGFYSEAGLNTCGSIWNKQTGGLGGGLYGHDEQDINLFFKTWGYDYLKVDYCGGQQQKLDERTRYTDIKKAIDNTGRTDINYNICRWAFPGTWVTKLANSWRISEDISPKWRSIIAILKKNTYLAPYASQGHYNDMDMLEVGMGLTPEEDKSHFSLWCMLSSPLLLGNDLNKVTPGVKAILGNKEVIAVDQDTTGVQAMLIADNGAGLQVWAKHLNGKQSKERAVLLFNSSETASPIKVNWADLYVSGITTVRDLWLHHNRRDFTDASFTAEVPAHGVVMLKVTGKENATQTSYEAEYAYLNNYNLLEKTVIKPNQARVVRNMAFSGGAKVDSLGNNPDNWIAFNEVYVTKAGMYELGIYYICNGDRDMKMAINGEETLLTKLNSLSLSNSKTRSVNIKLKKGYNTIRFYNPSAMMPDLDKITIKAL